MFYYRIFDLLYKDILSLTEEIISSDQKAALVEIAEHLTNKNFTVPVQTAIDEMNRILKTPELFERLRKKDNQNFMKFLSSFQSREKKEGRFINNLARRILEERLRSTSVKFSNELSPFSSNSEIQKKETEIAINELVALWKTIDNEMKIIRAYPAIDTIAIKRWQPTARVGPYAFAVAKNLLKGTIKLSISYSDTLNRIIQSGEYFDPNFSFHQYMNNILSSSHHLHLKFSRQVSLWLIQRLGMLDEASLKHTPLGYEALNSFIESGIRAAIPFIGELENNLDSFSKFLAVVFKDAHCDSGVPLTKEEAIAIGGRYYLDRDCTWGNWGKRKNTKGEIADGKDPKKAPFDNIQVYWDIVADKPILLFQCDKLSTFRKTDYFKHDISRTLKTIECDMAVSNWIHILAHKLGAWSGHALPIYNQLGFRKKSGNHSEFIRELIIRENGQVTTMREVMENSIARIGMISITTGRGTQNNMKVVNLPIAPRDKSFNHFS
ncbi:MAG: hypothetical protein ACE5OZ_18015 [Candidatus Heimdallarchaeota archaeon]